MLIIVMGLLMCGLLLGGLIYQLKTGTLVGRGWRVYVLREDNPILYWSSIILEAIVAFIFVAILLLAIHGNGN